MRKLFILFAVSLFAINVTYANTKNYNNDTPFVFVENNVEYAVFRNGDFDFNVLNNRNSNVRINTSFLNISFNTGKNYSPYIETNTYGEISQINRTPIFYDYKGRVSRIGNINVNYNRFGMVNSIGSLTVLYNNNGVFNRCVGYINSRNRNYRSNSRVYTHPKYRNNKVTNRNKVVYRTTKKYNNKSNNKTKVVYKTTTKRHNNYYNQNRSNSTNKKLNNYKTNTRTKSKTNTLVKNKKQALKTNNKREVVYSKRTNSNTYRR